jgi:hypothetical protein
MQKCPVCGAENESLAITCHSCKAFLQAKVDNLDLFATIWGLIESPRATMRRIVLSTHKNYVLALAALGGIATLLIFARWRSLGRGIELGSIFGLSSLFGIVAGILMLYLLAAFLLQISRILGGRGTLRNTRAVLAYSGVPLGIWLVIFLPIEFGIFGRYLFEGNPSPAVLQPVPYYVLLVLESGLSLWGLFLLATGLAEANTYPRWRGFVAVAVLLAVLTIAFVAGVGRGYGSGGV